MSFLVIAVLAVSVISKVRGRASLREFVAAVAQMRVVPARWAVPAATAAIVAEASVLALVAVPQTVQIGLGVATLLFGGFTAVLARAVSRGAQVGCHCFGASRTPVARRHVVRSGVLCAAALSGTLTLPSYPLTGIASPEILVAVVVAAIAATALVRLDDLFWLVRGGTRVS